MRFLVRHFLAVVAFAMIAPIGLLFTGCDSPVVAESGQSNDHDEDGHDDHDHDAHGRDDHDGHDHGHSDAHGPNGGEMVHLHPGHANLEWTHDEETGELVVYVDSLADQVDSVRVELNVTGSEMRTIDFESAELAEGAKVFRVTDPGLVTAIDIKEGVEAMLLVNAGDVEMSGKLECNHDHDHHGHSH